MRFKIVVPLVLLFYIPLFAEPSIREPVITTYVWGRVGTAKNTLAKVRTRKGNLIEIDPIKPFVARIDGETAILEPNQFVIHDFDTLVFSHNSIHYNISSGPIGVLEEDYEFFMPLAHTENFVSVDEFGVIRLMTPKPPSEAAEKEALAAMGLLWGPNYFKIRVPKGSIVRHEGIIRSYDEVFGWEKDGYKNISFESPSPISISSDWELIKKHQEITGKKIELEAYSRANR